ncbi:MAG: diguanylate cyclase [Bacillota bacterium]
MENSRESTLLLLMSDDPGTIGSVAANLDYEQFCLVIVRKMRDFSRFVERKLAAILMLDIQIQNIENVWQFIRNKAIKMPSILIITRETKLAPDTQHRVDEILYKPLDFLEMNKRLTDLANLIEMEQQLKREQRPLFEEGRPKILLVEDSAVQRSILTRQLTEHGFEVLTAADGEEAFAIAERTLPDLVLLDLMLPKVGGLEVCRRLKANPPTAAVPVIFITSSRSPEEKIKALECGAHDFLHKPVTRQELLIRIRFLLRQKQLLENLAEQARRDPLTGLGNRRQLMADLNLEMRRAKRYGTPLSLILLDVDQFKRYNDTHGHPAGDEVLRQLAGLLTLNVRAFDKVARYGGEEFVIILPQTNLQGAAAAAEKLRQAIEQYSFLHGETQPGGRLTVSLGVASYPEHAGDVDDLLRQADKAMYRAKAAGRNRVALAGPG